MKVKFTLPEDVVKKCFNFAVEIVTGKNQTSPDFGDPENIRGEVDKIADSFEGKLAEYAFSLFLADLSKKQFIINPDLNIYSGKSNIDYGNDLSDVSFRKRHHEFNRSRVDVKGTRMYSQWLLVESHKFWADAYVCVQVDLPRKIEKDEAILTKSVKGSIKCEVKGFAYHFDLIDSATAKPFIVYRRGTALLKAQLFNDVEWNPKILAEHMEESYKVKDNQLKVDLKAKANFALPMTKLRKTENDWREFLKWITLSLFPPPDLNITAIK